MSNGLFAEIDLECVVSGVAVIRHEIGAEDVRIAVKVHAAVQQIGLIRVRQLAGFSGRSGAIAGCGMIFLKSSALRRAPSAEGSPLFLRSAAKPKREMASDGRSRIAV